MPSAPSTDRAWVERATGKSATRTTAIGAALVLATLWIQAATPVMSEECYYWLYGVHLDWSYFDHPGMIGWAIRLGTRLFGNNAIGLRLVAGLSWLCTTWIGLRWLRDLGGSRSSERLWLALSVPHVLYAAEVRFYALMTLMTVLQLWAFATVAARPTARSWAVYAAVNVLYLLTGLFAAFALVWQYLVFLGRALDLALPHVGPSRTVRFARAPQGEDPDDIFSRGGAEALIALVAAARPMSDVLFEREKAKGLATPEARDQARLTKSPRTRGSFAQLWRDFDLRMLSLFVLAAMAAGMVFAAL